MIAPDKEIAQLKEYLDNIAETWPQALLAYGPGCWFERDAIYTATVQEVGIDNLPPSVVAQMEVFAEEFEARLLSAFPESAQNIDVAQLIIERFLQADNWLQQFDAIIEKQS